MNKPPPNSLYSKLTEDQRAQLYDWILTLGYPKTRERIALPEPEGFGITTHISSIHRFYLRYVAETDTDFAAEAEDVSAPPPTRLFPLAEQAAHAGAFRFATTPLDTDSFGELSQWVSTQQANQLKRDYMRIAEQNTAIAQKKMAVAENRLELEREKFQFNAARQALIHFAGLAIIARNRNADDEAKIKAAAALLFQAAPMPTDRGQPQNAAISQPQDTSPKSPASVETPNQQEPGTPPEGRPLPPGAQPTSN